MATPIGHWVRLGTENDVVSVPSNTRVRYGADSRWAEAIVSGSFRADNARFGDPAPGVKKEVARFDVHGWQMGDVALQPFLAVGHWMRIGGEHNTITVGPNTRVRYGKDSRWAERVVSGTFVADNRLFGDPAHGVAKDVERFELTGWQANPAFAQPHPPHHGHHPHRPHHPHHPPYPHAQPIGPGAGHSQWVHIGFENDTVTVPPNTQVRYGHGKQWAQRVLSGTFRADNALFGDPAPGVRKAVERLDTPSFSVVHTTVTTHTTTTPVYGGAAPVVYPVQQTGYPVQQPSFPVQQPGYPIQQPGYPVQQAGYPVQQAGYPAQQAGYPAQQPPGFYPPPTYPGYPPY